MLICFDFSKYPSQFKITIQAVDWVNGRQLKFCVLSPDGGQLSAVCSVEFTGVIREVLSYVILIETL